MLMKKLYPFRQGEGTKNSFLKREHIEILKTNLVKIMMSTLGNDKTMNEQFETYLEKYLK